jgi:hypothetical protein
MEAPASAWWESTMGSDEGQPPRGWDGAYAWAIDKVRDDYSLTLIMTVMTIGALAGVGIGRVESLTAELLTGATLLVALLSSRANSRVIVAAAAYVGLCAVVAALAVASGDAVAANIGTASIGLILAVVIPFVILRHIARSPAITFRLVTGALVAYLLIGLCYAYIFALLSLISGAPFFVQTSDPSTATYLYFSFTTLSTVGYGDYAAATEMGQLIAVSEGLFGQMYLVSIVAVLVSNVGHPVHRARGQQDGSTVDPIDGRG